MYQVLYRKWRPKLFEDVVGQPQVTVTLKGELQSNRISHAYLFTGSRGTGKTSCAKILAKAVNCTNIKNGEPCGVCPSCVGIDDGSVMDIVEIDAASNNGIDNIRELKEEANFTPSFLKYRVYIIDEVHMLSIGAFNALLKILEEPPKHVIFILATTEIHKLPSTIISRCQRFDFNRISAPEIANKIKMIAKNENIIINDNAALLLARISEGSLRDALSLLDQCSGYDNNITVDIVTKVAGLSSTQYIFELTEYLIDKNLSQIFVKLNELYKASKDMTKLCEELLNHFRNMMIIKILKKPEDVVVLSPEDFERIKIQADKLSNEQIIYAIDVFQKAIQKIARGNENIIEVELAFIKLNSPELDTSNEALLARIYELEQLIKNGNFNKKSSKQEKKIKNLNTNSENPIEKQADELTIKDEKDNLENNNINNSSTDNEEVELNNWTDIIKDLKNNSSSLSVALKGSKAYIKNNLIYIDTNSELAKKLLSRIDSIKNIKLSVKNILGKEINITGQDAHTQDNENTYDALDNFLDEVKKSNIDII